MSDVVDFKIVSDNGLTDSSLSASLAGFRAGKAKYFSRKYHSQYVSFSPDEKKREISHFNQILLEERQLIFDSPIIAVALYEDVDVFWPEFYYQNGMVLNLLYEKHGQDGKNPKRAVGIVLVEGAAIPDALVGKFKFAHQRSKLAGDVRGTYFVVKQNWDELLFGGKKFMTLFEEYIQASRGLAFVATSKQNQPSVRIMGFAPDPDQPNIWYFNSKPNTEKMIDLAANENVSIITPLNQNGARIESNHATMRRSDKKWADIKDLFANNKPYLHAHPDVENEVILVLEIHSARLASYAGTEIVNFD